jgi:gliding motility-associated lipoprotein GldD
MDIQKGFGTLVAALLVTLGLVSCHHAYTPKPRGYFKIDFPQKDYRVFDEKGYPYSFEYPVYAKIIKDTSFFNKQPENPWWINVDFPQFHGKIYLSYKVIGPQYSLEKLVNDAYTMTYKNTVKADAIVPEMFQTPNQVSGMFYNVSGNAATARQFYATDSVRHFLRGALYFYAVPNADSLKPVIEFVEKDMWHMLETLRWKPGQAR